jgi:putative flippase GtrA
VKRIGSIALSPLSKQTLFFVITSGSCWILDFMIFFLLSTVLTVNSIISNMISASAAVSVVFWVSIRKNFRNREGSIDLRWKYLIYLSYQGLSIFLYSLLIAVAAITMVRFLPDQLQYYDKLTAKIVVTPLNLFTNFLFMKLLIEKI